MAEHEQQLGHSEANSIKLDRLLVWLEGDEAAPGVIARIKLMEAIFFGKEGQRGMVQEHIIMWRIHVWLLCSASAVAGGLMTLLVQKIAKLI